MIILGQPGGASNRASRVTGGKQRADSVTTTVPVRVLQR
jgi:hypothetical protein